MPFLAVLQILVLIYFCVHAVKTGRDRYWLYILIIFPFIGCLVYFFAEYLPELMQDPKVRKKLGKLFTPKKQLRELEYQVENTPSVRNRTVLAEAYVHARMFDNAIDTYQKCLEDIREDDLSIIEGLSCAYFFKGDFENAKQYLEKLLKTRENRKGDQFDLLYARTLEELGDIDDALKAYSEFSRLFSGEEARCRYAMLLAKVGKNQEAENLFNEILRNSRLSPKFYVREQKQWIDIAKKQMKHA